MSATTIARTTLVSGMTLGMLLLPAAAYAGPNWDAIIECESGGDPNAENPTSTASGLYQITDGTWQDHGGKGSHAADASVKEQTRVALEIYAERGLSPWKSSRSCWADAAVSAPVADAQGLVDVPAAVGPVEPAEGSLEAHTVVTGDTLSALAELHDTTVPELVEQNRLADPDSIRVGATVWV